MLDIALEHNHKAGKITFLSSLSFIVIFFCQDIQKSTTLLLISKSEPHVNQVGRLRPPLHAGRSNSVTQLLFADQISCVLRGRHATHSLDVQSQSIRLGKKKKSFNCLHSVLFLLDLICIFCISWCFCNNHWANSLFSCPSGMNEMSEFDWIRINTVLRRWAFSHKVYDHQWACCLAMQLKKHKYWK